jgi:hypothetical protein
MNKKRRNPIAYHIGSVRYDEQSRRWTCNITLHGVRIRRKFIDKIMAEKVLKMLQLVKEYEYAKRHLERWGLEGRLTPTQLLAMKTMDDKEFRNMNLGQKEQVVMMFNEILETLPHREKRRKKILATRF